MRTTRHNHGGRQARLAVYSWCAPAPPPHHRDDQACAHHAKSKHSLPQPPTTITTTTAHDPPPHAPLIRSPSLVRPTRPTLNTAFATSLRENKSCLRPMAPSSSLCAGPSTCPTAASSTSSVPTSRCGLGPPPRRRRRTSAPGRPPSGPTRSASTSRASASPS
jgi:hypothetical protein